ncbi:GNAT family protein [Ensifer adhaerens]|uniref:GNAT family N-acetyltransferase n=1 Tax=Ensifer adhaerens TaxID=106592 RepID=UPI0023A9D394|nr:GNAT family protein [Ensifer adhaerens]WDZ78478.1 GNAT family protein [Ensifer adhaerens]
MNVSSDTPPDLRGDGFVLRRPRDGDADARLRLGRHPQIYRMFGAGLSSPGLFGHGEAAAWVARIAGHPAAWIIDQNGLAGEVRLDNINHADRRASFAIGIFDPRRLGKGLGTAVTQRVLAYAFSELALHRVSLRVLSFNERAIAAYRKSGFSIEGRERESALIDGEWHDDIMMGILAAEFDARHAAPRNE